MTTREELIEAMARALGYGAGDRDDRPEFAGRSLSNRQAVAVAEAALDAARPLIVGMLADKVRSHGDAMGDPDPGWLAGLASAAYLIEGVRVDE